MGDLSAPAVVVVCDGEPAAMAALRAHTPEPVAIVRSVAEAPGDAHLALVAPGVDVAEGWLAGLLAARGDDDAVATVSAVVLPEIHPATAAARLHAATAGPRPRLEAPDLRCLLIAHPALELAGPLDDGFAERCSALGLLHVLAGDVPVAAPAAAASVDDEPEPVLRVRRRARALADGLAVTVDARILREPVAGTQVHTLELLAALHRIGGVHVRALVPPNPSPTAAAVLEGLPNLELLNSDDVDDETPATPVVHRPYQVSSPIDLLTLRQVGERLVVTHQDLLSYRNPAYHVDRFTWEEHRRLTRRALAAAYAVVAFSEHAATDLRAEELAQERLRVVPIGVDHSLSALGATPRRPAALPHDDVPFLLCLGSDLRHKNRPFAIALTRALRARHGWPGRLVLAGPHAPQGSSATEEAALLAREPDLAVDGGIPDEAEKAWLYAHAAAVVYPTTYEGFGLVPFEAAEHGTPCLFAPVTALREHLADSALLVPWDAEASADRAVAVLSAGPERAALVDGVQRAGNALTWDATARALVDIYATTLDAPTGIASWEALRAEAERSDWEHRYWWLFNTIGPTGLSLVGADALLPEPAQRALAALARRPLTRRPLLSGLAALGRLAQRGRS